MALAMVAAMKPSGCTRCEPCGGTQIGECSLSSFGDGIRLDGYGGFGMVFEKSWVCIIRIMRNLCILRNKICAFFNV